MTISDVDVYRAARVCYALMYEDAAWQPSVAITDRTGPFADVIARLEEYHQQAAELTAKTGELYDIWGDARTVWEGLRASDDGTKQYGRLDQEIRAYAAMRIEVKPNANGHSPDRPLPPVEYKVVPSIPTDVNDLLDMERKPTIWYAPSFLREGLGLLVGQPNVGKTPAAIQLMIALATGGKWFNVVQCRQAKVLYLGMEYSPQELIPMFDISRMGLAIPRNWLLVKTIEDDFPTSADAALEELEWYLRVMEVRVICIDVLTAFLPPEKFKQNVYRGDYSELKPYHRLALKYNASILGIWHASKRESDPRIMYNGSTGMWAAAASRITMYQDQEQRVRISSFPRMGDKVDWALTQEKTNKGRRWVVADAAPEPLMSPAETQIYRCLKAHADKSKPISPSTIAELISIPVGTVKSAVRRLFSENILQQIGNGYFIEVATDATDATDATRSTDATVANATDLQPIDTATESGETARLQRLQGFTDAPDATDTQPLQTPIEPYTSDEDSFFACVPPSKRTALRLRLRSNSPEDQEVAQARCKEYGLDYEQAKREVQ